MTITNEALGAASGTTIGPARITGSGSAVTVEVDGRSVAVALEESAVRLSLVVKAQWPSVELPAAEISAEIDRTLAELGRSVPALSSLVAEEDEGRVVVHHWIDPASSLVDLCREAQTVASVAAAVLSAFERVDASLGVRLELQTLAETEQRFREELEAESGSDESAPAPPSPPAPPAPAAGSPAAPLYWAHVNEAVDLVGNDAARTKVGELRPGSWYAVHEEQGAWARVADGAGAEGWVGTAALTRQ